jgi:hypothetical protein
MSGACNRKIRCEVKKQEPSRFPNTAQPIGNSRITGKVRDGGTWLCLLWLTRTVIHWGLSDFSTLVCFGSWSSLLDNTITLYWLLAALRYLHPRASSYWKVSDY